MNFMWEALLILFVGFCLFRIAGKKTVSEMTGLEIITLLSIASVVSHAVSMDGLWQTIVTLSLFVALLITVQALAVRFDWVERWFMGRATVVVQDGKIVARNLKKLRMSVDQLEARLREKGITSFADVKYATIEMSGQLGYELMRHAKPVTIGELEKILAPLLNQQPQKQREQANLFVEVMHPHRQHEVSHELE